jgi:hypothetical protein
MDLMVMYSTTSKGLVYKNCSPSPIGLYCRISKLLSLLLLLVVVVLSCVNLSSHAPLSIFTTDSHDGPKLLILFVNPCQLRKCRARICKPLKAPRNRFPAWGSVKPPYFTYRLARLLGLTESIPWIDSWAP